MTEMEGTYVPEQGLWLADGIYEVVSGSGVWSPIIERFKMLYYDRRLENFLKGTSFELRTRDG